MKLVACHLSRSREGHVFATSFRKVTDRMASGTLPKVAVHRTSKVLSL